MFHAEVESSGGVKFWDAQANAPANVAEHRQGERIRATTMSRLAIEEARAAVEKLANELRGNSSDSGPLVVVPGSVKRFNGAWYMCVQTQRFVETGDRRYVVPGTPCFVVEDNGRIVRQPQRQRTDEFLAAYGPEVDVNYGNLGRQSS